MYSYFDFKGPSQRAGMMQGASWNGPDDNLTLEVQVFDSTGVLKTVVFRTTSSTHGVGDICLPSSADVTALRDEIVIAHLRMATLIADVPFGSTEWNTALLEGVSSNLQTAIGVVKLKPSSANYTNPRMLDQINAEIDFVKSGTSNPVKTLSLTKDQLPLRSIYENPTVAVDPEFQCGCIAGAIEKQFPSYVHDAPGTVLTQARKDEIAAYVLTLPLWV